MTIKVSIKEVFGNERIYPKCEKSEVFAKLVKQKTLTRDDISRIKELGFSVEVVTEVSEL